MKNPEFIKLRNVGKYYMKGKTRVTVHENVNLTIPEGCLTALMGPSGCGKTTLLNMIGGLDHCTSGSIEIGGREISSMSENQLAAWRATQVGFVFQFYNLMQVLSAERNVEVPLLLTHLDRKKRMEHVHTALEIVGLADRAGHLPGELSGGQEQRVAIARAIVSDPAMLICDEPTGDLDRKMADEIMSLLKELNTRFGKTIVMVTHDSHVVDTCDFVVNVEEADLSDCHLGMASAARPAEDTREATA
jgi:putative ABC transport system ATP-binding protein